jgi:hypothetical protein
MPQQPKHYGSNEITSDGSLGWRPLRVPATTGAYDGGLRCANQRYALKDRFSTTKIIPLFVAL